MREQPNPIYPLPKSTVGHPIETIGGAGVVIFIFEISIRVSVNISEFLRRRIQIGRPIDCTVRMSDADSLEQNVSVAEPLHGGNFKLLEKGIVSVIDELPLSSEAR
jgi:hypothetical protein